MTQTSRWTKEKCFKLLRKKPGSWEISMFSLPNWGYLGPKDVKSPSSRSTRHVAWYYNKDERQWQWGRGQVTTASHMSMCLSFPPPLSISQDIMGMVVCRIVHRSWNYVTLTTFIAPAVFFVLIYRFPVFSPISMPYWPESISTSMLPPDLVVLKKKWLDRSFL